MIPPLQDLRMRSISRWLKDNPETAKLPSEALHQRVQELDEMMIEAFEEQEDALMDRLSKAKIWGTEEGLRQLTTGRMELWQETCSEFLPTFALDSAD